jgi:hypothetical protein
MRKNFNFNSTELINKLFIRTLEKIYDHVRTIKSKFQTLKINYSQKS